MFEPKYVPKSPVEEPRGRYWWLGRLQPLARSVENLLDGARWWVITRPAQSAVTIATVGLLTAGVLHTLTENNNPNQAAATAADTQAAPATAPSSNSAKPPAETLIDVTPSTSGVPADR